MQVNFISLTIGYHMKEFAHHHFVGEFMIFPFTKLLPKLQNNHIKISAVSIHNDLVHGKYQTLL